MMIQLEVVLAFLVKLLPSIERDRWHEFWFAFRCNSDDSVDVYGTHAGPLKPKPPQQVFVSFREEIEAKRAADPKVMGAAQAIIRRLDWLPLARALEAAEAVIEHMESDRPYRPAMTHADEALASLSDRGMVNPYKKPRPASPRHFDEEV